jgi:hypothetical protein
MLKKMRTYSYVRLSFNMIFYIYLLMHNSIIAYVKRYKLPDSMLILYLEYEAMIDTVKGLWDQSSQPISHFVSKSLLDPKYLRYAAFAKTQFYHCLSH